MGTSFEILKAKLKEELKNPTLTDLRSAYIIQKIKLLNNHKPENLKPGKPGIS